MIHRRSQCPSRIQTQSADRSRTVFESGDAITDIATETGISAATLFRWKDQALIDAGVRDGAPSIESDELASARTRIVALEAELAFDPRCVRLVRRSVGGAPKRKIAIVEGLVLRGHSGRSACRVTGLSRSTFHAHRCRPVSDRRVRRIIVADTIEKIHQRSVEPTGSDVSEPNSSTRTK